MKAEGRTVESTSRCRWHRQLHNVF